MTALRRGVLALGLLTACHAADAFGPRAHLWIAQQVLDDLRAGCNVQLAGKAYQVASDRCQAITSNPDRFFARALGPDIYPDVIAGENTVHSGVKDGWDTAEFLGHVLSGADTPSSSAFATEYPVDTRFRSAMPIRSPSHFSRAETRRSVKMAVLRNRL